MKLWRLYRQAFGPGIDGAGGLYRPGRWHSQGRPVTYFGATAAIVVLEKLAHLDPALLESDLMLGEFEGELSIEDAWPPELDSLPFDLGDLVSTRHVGDEWLAGKSSCLLRVPSILLPEELNLVFNPVHPDAGKISLIRERAFTFDGRLI